MKKILVALSFLIITLTSIDLSGSSGKMATALTSNVWKFESVASENITTSHYLNTIYQGTEYRFSDDNNFTGSFFGLAISGTWSVSNDTLFLNKGTHKEEMYTYTIADRKGLILKGTERGDKVLMSFVKE